MSGRSGGQAGRAGFAVAVLAVVLCFAPSASARTIEVETGADQFGSGGDCSLREAFRAANQDAGFGGCRAGNGEDTLELGSRSHELARTGPPDDDATNGDLDATAPLTIDGRGRGDTTIDGGGAAVAERVIEVLTGDQVTITDLAVVDGLASDSGEFNGGGVNLDSGGELIVRDSRIANNRATVDGGGLNVEDPAGVLRVESSKVTGNVGESNGGGINGDEASLVTVRDTLVADNEVPDCCNGGGIDVESGVDLVVDESEIRNNSTGSNGGGIYGSGDELLVRKSSIVGNSGGSLAGGLLTRSGPTKVRRTTIAGNQAGTDGGGIGVLSDGPLRVQNSTISGNDADRNGGGVGVLDPNGTVKLRSTTVTDNVADADSQTGGDGGGIAPGGSRFSLLNTLLAVNVDLTGDDEDCTGTLKSRGHNLVGVDDCVADPKAGDQIGTVASPIDPRVRPLEPNGGPTETHALRSDSPAVDAGNPGEPGSGIPACPGKDQRGEQRDDCDIGAFER